MCGPRENFMVEKLKNSLENLDPPECPHCRVEMKWYRSELVQSDPAYIEHHFMCASCNRTAKRRDKVEDRSGPLPPEKLSRGRYSRAA